MSAKSWEYRQWRVHNGKTVNWSFVRKCIRYRQEVRALQRDGFQECHSWATLPFEDQLGRKRIVDTRIANEGKSLWVKVTERETA